jgi:hypothetical protein
VNPCARTVAIAAARPSALEGCEANAGSVAVRVVEASVPPLAGLVVVAAGVEVVDGADCAGEPDARAGVLAVLALFELEPHAESAAHPASASHPIRRIGLIVRCAAAHVRRVAAGLTDLLVAANLEGCEER